MLETATLVSNKKDMYNTPGIEEINELENYCKINGKPFKIRILVKRQKDRRFAYYYGAINIKFIY